MTNQTATTDATNQAYYLLKSDWECNSEEFWEAFRESEPSLYGLMRGDYLVVSAEELRRLQSLPGWETGVEIAPTAMQVMEQATCAEVIAERLGDGQTWETEDGQTLQALIDAYGGLETTPVRGTLAGNRRYELPDGSAIVTWSETAWDVGFRRPANIDSYEDDAWDLCTCSPEAEGGRHHGEGSEDDEPSHCPLAGTR